MAKILRFEKNENGRDFVMGDIHGHFDAVVAALELVQYDTKVDRLFCVGDLIDRGPDSRVVPEFLALPGIHSVRGNHEQMLLDLAGAEDYGVAVSTTWGIRNGMQWWDESIPESEKIAILEAISALPVMIEIETVRGLVGVIHAEVPIGMSWAECKEAVLVDDPKALNEVLWGRNRFYRAVPEVVEGVGRIFCGHTPLHKPVKLGNIVGLDTGLAYSNTLTMVDALASTKVLLGPKVEGKINIVSRISDSAFGSYSSPEMLAPREHPSVFLLN